MPRLAYILGYTTITLIEISENPTPSETVTLQYSKHASKKDTYNFDKVVASACTERQICGQARVLTLFGAAVEKYCEDLNDPGEVIRALHSVGARQCVWNGTKLIATRKLKEDQSLFFAQHLKEFSTQAPSEKIAKERLTRIITDTMVARPDRAKDLASWFAAGQPVVEEKPGAALSVTSFVEAFPFCSDPFAAVEVADEEENSK